MAHGSFFTVDTCCGFDAPTKARDTAFPPKHARNSGILSNCDITLSEIEEEGKRNE
jgi:hypothetical protein